MLQMLMGPNVEILMGQSFASWTHGHGPMAMCPLGTTHFPGARAMGPGPGPWARPWAQGHGPMPMCPGAKALAHEYFDIWAHKYF